MAALVNYSESSEENSDTDDLDASKTTVSVCERNSIKESVGNLKANIESVPVNKKMRLETPQPSQLEMPKTILEMFGKKEISQHLPDPELYNRRKRTFAHVEGNWATFVYIACEMDEHMLKLRDDLFKCLRPFGDFQPMSDHHISLSRTVVVRHHWIEPLQEAMRDRITSSNIHSGVCAINGIEIYTNDEKTRSFLGLKVSSGSNFFHDLIDIVDESFNEFKLPSYYKDPSFHLSIGWVLGDLTKVPSNTSLSLQEIVSSSLEENPEMALISVEEILLKAGNKIFKFPLTNT